jgi:hypothetical protein
MYGNAPPPAPPPGGYGPPPGGYGPPGGPPGYGPPPGPGYPPPGANPYAAPQVGGAVGGPIVPAGSGMKWLYVAGWVGCWIFTGIGYGIIAAVSSSSPGEDPGALIALPLVGMLFLVLAPIGSLVWLYKAWASVPPDMRCTDAGKWVTPGSAVGYLFIPFFNLYWIFIANVGLCEAVNRTLLSRGGQARAPKGLAIAASISHLVPYCNLLVSPILWTIYMIMMDGARREMVNRVGQTTF